MSDVIRLWVEASHNGAFRCGGWAFVLAQGRVLSGAVGGERTSSPERIALAGLVAALKAAPTGSDLEVFSANPYVITAPRRIVDVREPPSEDLDLWAQVVTALKGRPVHFRSAKSQPNQACDFTAAWAELARDRAKATGAFRAVIPRPNLAKVSI